MDAAVEAEPRRAQWHQRRRRVAQLLGSAHRMACGVSLPQGLAKGVSDEMAVVEEAVANEAIGGAYGGANRPPIRPVVRAPPKLQRL